MFYPREARQTSETQVVIGAYENRSWFETHLRVCHHEVRQTRETRGGGLSQIRRPVCRRTCAFLNHTSVLTCMAQPARLHEVIELKWLCEGYI